MSQDFDFENTPTAAPRLDFSEVYFSPEEGINTIRIASLSGKKFKSHYMVVAGGKKKFVKCPGAGCPICIEGTNKASNRYLLKIIDRKNNKLRVWEFGPQIMTQIQEFVTDIKTNIKSGATDADDKLADYNIQIRRREPGTNPLYSIQVKERLTTDQRFKSVADNDAKIIAEDKLNLDDLAKPWTIDRINTQIFGTQSSEAPVMGSAKPAVAQAVVSKPNLQELSAKASTLSDDDDWLK